MANQKIFSFLRIKPFALRGVRVPKDGTFDRPDARHASTYWAVLKKRLNAAGSSELLPNCKQLKLKASDEKRRLIDA